MATSQGDLQKEIAILEDVEVSPASKWHSKSPDWVGLPASISTPDTCQGHAQRHLDARAANSAKFRVRSFASCRPNIMNCGTNTLQLERCHGLIRSSLQTGETVLPKAAADAARASQRELATIAAEEGGEHGAG